MPDRYFTESPLDGLVRLEGPEAHHLAHVMRARPGDELTLFNGTGVEATARVEKIGRATIDLTVLSQETVDRELPGQMTLAVSLPKGDRQRWLVEKATELGVARLVPLVTARGVAQPVASAIDRLRRSVVEASKQCGRNRLMEIAEPAQFGEYVARASTAVRWIAEPDKTENESPGASFPADFADVVFAVGPEGGFTQNEVSAAIEAGWRPLDLGARILRVETAAIALAAMAALFRPQIQK